MRHAYADAHTYSYPYTNANTYADADPNTYAYAYALHCSFRYDQPEQPDCDLRSGECQLHRGR